MKLEHVKEDTDRKLGKRQVNMANDLTRAAHNLTLGEKRVVMSCVAQLDSLRLESGRYKVRLAAQEFAEAFNIADNTAYEQLKEVAVRLYERSVKREVDTPKGKKIIKHRWVSAITYHEGEGWIELGFSHEITPYLVALRGNHTSYKLEQASALRSVYSWRLLEMMMQFKSTGLLRIDIDEFCHAMEVPETYRKNFKDLRNRVINIAVSELTEKDGWQIEWEGKKHGSRRVNSLEFKFKKNPQSRLVD